MYYSEIDKERIAFKDTKPYSMPCYHQYILFLLFTAARPRPAVEPAPAGRDVQAPGDVTGPDAPRAAHHLLWYRASIHRRRLLTGQQCFQMRPTVTESLKLTVNM